MPKKVISILEFLRTGKLAGLAPGCTTDDVIRVLGKPDYEYESIGVKNVSNYGYDSLEIWFHTQTRVVNRFSFKRLRTYLQRDSRRKHKHSFEQSIPRISRNQFDPWVIREHLELETLKRFLKTANLQYVQSQWKIGVDQLDLQSGVCLLFDPPDFDMPGLGYISIQNDELIRNIEQENTSEQGHAIES